MFPAIFVLKCSLQAPEPAKWSTVAASSVMQLLCNLRYSDMQAIALGGEII